MERLWSLWSLLPARDPPSCLAAVGEGCDEAGCRPGAGSADSFVADLDLARIDLDRSVEDEADSGPRQWQPSDPPIGEAPSGGKTRLTSAACGPVAHRANWRARGLTPASLVDHSGSAKPSTAAGVSGRDEADIRVPVATYPRTKSGFGVGPSLLDRHHPVPIARAVVRRRILRAHFIK